MLISKNFLTREASYKPSYLISWIHREGDSHDRTSSSFKTVLGAHIASAFDS